MTIPPLAEIRKAIVVVLGVAAMLVSSGVLSGQTLVWVNVVIGVLTAVVHYVVPNAQPAGPPVAGPPV